MGMFDTVIIEQLKLNTPKVVSNFLSKNNAPFPTEFQTKDLECSLIKYRIDKKGQIYETIGKPTGKKVEWKNPFKGWNNNKCFLVRLYDNLKTPKKERDKKLFVDEIKYVEIKSKLSKSFNVYAYEEVAGRYLDIEYNVQASKGRVTRTKLVSWSIESEEDSKKRQQTNKEFDERFAREIARRNAFASKWYYPILKEIYNPIVFFAKLIVFKLCTKLSNWSVRWNGI